jgi:hypothetical protein
MGRGLVLLVALSCCDSDGDAGASDGPDPERFPEFGVCARLEQCAPGLECHALGTASYCLRPCSVAVPCPADLRCDDTGYCLRAAAYFAPCGRLDACSNDALCDSQSLTATPRCVPICDVGDLVGKSAVAACPALPAEISAGPVRCQAGARDGTTASFCVAEVAIGETCDEMALRCNPEGARADTDASTAVAGAPEPGAPRCLPVFGSSICARVCTTDGGATTSPCGCPGSDALCADPSDPGLAWECVHWTELATGLGACAPVESCASGSECDDNTASGFVACVTSPYDSPSGSICGP